MPATHKGFEIELSDARANGLFLAIDKTRGASLAKNLKEKFAEALNTVAEQESLYERYGDHSFPDRDDPRVAQIIVHAVEKVQGREIVETEAFRHAVYDEIAGALAETYDDSDGLIQEAFQVFGDPDAIASQLEKIAAELGVELEPSDEGYDDLSDWVLGQMESAIDNADRSTPLDLINRMNPIRMFYRARPEGASPCLDDSVVTFDSHSSAADEVIPDENFMAFLQLINVAVHHYIAAVKTLRGVDLLDPNQCGRARQWAAAAVGNEPADLMRPPVVSPETAVVIVENSYTCCNPVLVLDMPVRVLMKMTPGSQLLVKGGQVGLHDFINGAGHITEPGKPIRVPANLKLWGLEDGRINSVYDCLGRAYAAEVSLYEASPQRALPLTADLGR